MKRFISVLLPLALMLSFVPPAFAANYAPGTYTGEGNGFGGKVAATIIISSDKVTSCTLTGNGETPAIGGAALAKLEQQVEVSGNAEIDGVAGATMTSNAAKAAVAAALKSAKVDVDPPSVTPPMVTSENQPSSSNFHRQTTYVEGCFDDVSSSDWYASGVQGAFEFCLMKGCSENTFGTNETLTVAEAIALVARLHSIYNGNGDNFKQESPWYQVYIDYATENNLISSAYSDYSAPIYRGDFAYILKNALPGIALPQINTVEDGAIPDVPKESYIYDSVYKLYRAGILTGNDGKGTFTPDTTIDRASVATIVTRMADANQRSNFTLTVDYSYIVASDFRRIRRNYPNAVAIFGTYETYTNSDGEKCLVSYVKYEIISRYEECILHNLTTGETTRNPEQYFNDRIDRAYGSSRLHLYDLYQEFLTAYQAALNKYLIGDYIGADYLNL